MDPPFGWNGAAVNVVPHPAAKFSILSEAPPHLQPEVSGCGQPKIALIELRYLTVCDLTLVERLPDALVEETSTMLATAAKRAFIPHLDCFASLP